MQLKILILFIFSLSYFSSCSMLDSSSRPMMERDASHGSKNGKVKWVSKDQYDELMVKYKELSEKHEKLKEEKITNSQRVDLADELFESPQIEKVSVYNSKPVIQEVTKPTSSNKAFEQELFLYKKGRELAAKSQFPEALKIFQSLNQSQFNQIAIRSKYQTGKIHLGQNQFDVALQVFEDVINSGAFSSIVIDALKAAVICSEKLGATQKLAQYQSLLVDVFGMDV
jgi:tetratricopeptide (TPR) repeat protein